MNARPLAATRGRMSTVGTTVIVVALVTVGGQTIARAQSGRAATNQRPPQSLAPPISLYPYNLNPYSAPYLGGSFSPYPVKDPTANERAVVAGRVYQAVLDERTRRAISPPRSGQAEPKAEARSDLELIERLGQWSLRWQDAQDNAAKSRAARYQAMADHLGRMSALEDGRFLRETGQAAGGAVGPKPARESAEVARFFRPIDEWDIDQIIPTFLVSERPLNPRGVAVTPAEQEEIADRVYHAILEGVVAQFLASTRGGETRPDQARIGGALLAERLGFWSDLWRQFQEILAQDPSRRLPAVGDRSARLPSVGGRNAGAAGRTAAMRSHVERMTELENGRFMDDALKRAGSASAGPVDMARFREFAEVVRFFRIEAESRLPVASRPRGSDVTESGQAATAGRIYGAILDEAAHQYQEAPRAGEAPVDLRIVFGSRLAERLAMWSIRWARAQIHVDTSRVSQFSAVRSHLERMASLEDGRSFHDALERASHRVVGDATPAPPREFEDVAQYFRLEAQWELVQFKSR